MTSTDAHANADAHVRAPIWVPVRPLARHALLGELLRAGVQMNDLARVLLETEPFSGLQEASYRVDVRAVGSLPGCESGATLGALCTAADAAGLRPLPLPVAAFLALEGGQEFPSAVVVLSEPVSDNPQYPRGLYVVDARGQRWLRGFVEDPGYVYAPTALVALRAE